MTVETIVPTDKPAAGNRQRVTGTAAAILVLCCALWGLNQVAIKLGGGGISPALQAGLRSLAAAVLLVGWMGARRLKLFPRDGTLPAGILIGVLFAGEFILLYSGLTRTTAAHSVVLLYSSPFAVAIGSHFLVPGDRLTRNKIVGLLAAFAGIVLAFAERLGGIDSASQLLGDAMCLGAGMLWGATTVAIKATRMRSAPAENTLLYQLVVSAAILLPLSPLLGERGIVDFSTTVALAFAYQVVIVAFASFLVWFWLIRHYAASVISSFAFLTPVFGVFFAWLLLGEPISISLIGAVILIAIGIYIVNRG
jgi:drug/metabolite transporter (DMT)-like permease